MKRQVFIDPVYVRGNVLEVYIWWDWKSRGELRVEFPSGKLVKMDRFQIIGFVLELMRRSGIDTWMEKEDLMDLKFKEFPGLKISYGVCYI